MKTKKILLIILSLFVGSSLFSQDLEASIEADKSIYVSNENGNLFRPLQSRKSFSFKIKIKNKANTIRNFYIDKKGTFPFWNWVEIPKNKAKTVIPDSTAIFDVNINIPNYESDRTCPNTLFLFLRGDDGKYKSTSYDVNLFQFSFFVDNTPPTNLRVQKKSFTKNKIIVLVSAFDKMCSEYTDTNPDSGKDGIEKIKIQLKDLSGKLIDEQEVKVKKEWKDIEMQIKNKLESGTTYKLYATATDLAGNTADPIYTEFTTKLAIPTNLTATNIRYTDFTLNWDTVNKAVGYEVYEITDSKERLIGITTETKLHIKKLKMGETYEYAVKAKYNNGVSEYSETLSVTTEYTRIVGEPMICKQESYTIEKLLPNTTVKWRTSNNNLELVSGQGTGTATFTKRKDGECKIIANIEDGTQILTEEVYVGVPLTAEMEVTLNNEIVYDNDNTYNLPTLYSDELNVLEVKTVSDPPFYHENPIPFSVFSVASYPFIYEWRIKSHAYYWDFYDFPRKKNDVLNNKAYVKYEDVDNGAIPFAFFKPIFQVRKYNNCGCSEWKDIENFNVKYPYQNNSVYYFLSPNGDGANDTFEIVQKQQTYRSSPTTSIFNLTIFNKNGEAVYQKENYMQDTERFYGVGNVGSFMGTELPNGDYFFRITGSEQRSGNIYIKRD